MAQPKILIVDDDADHRRGLNLRLRANHYDTAFAADAMQAVSAARKDRPDLVLLDLSLPGGDGIVVMERFRANAELSVIPVIVITGRDPLVNRATRARGRRRGVLSEAGRQRRAARRHPRSAR